MSGSLALLVCGAVLACTCAGAGDALDDLVAAAGARGLGGVCAQRVDVDSHVLIEYNVSYSDGSQGPFVQLPDQLFHLHLSYKLASSMLFSLVGACVNQTVTMTREGPTVVDISPLVSPAMHLSTALTMVLNITIHHVTSAQDFKIFEALATETSGPVLELLEQHVGVNAVDEWGQTALMISVQRGDLTIISDLLNTNRPRVDVNHAKASGHTALFYALQLPSPDIVRALLYRGADPNAILLQPGSRGNTPLHVACALEKPRHARALLEYGAKPYLVNEHGQAPLQMLPVDASASNRLAFKRLHEEYSGRTIAGSEL